VGAAEAVAKSGFLAILIFMLIPYLTPTLPSSRRYLVLFPVIALTFLLIGRAFYVATLARLFFRRRTLIIGAGWAGSTVLQALRQHGDDTYHIVGFIDDDPAKAEMAVMAGRTAATDTSVEVAPPDAPRVIGNRNDLDELLSSRRVKSLILAINHDIDAELLSPPVRTKLRSDGAVVLITIDAGNGAETVLLRFFLLQIQGLVFRRNIFLVSPSGFIEWTRDVLGRRVVRV
jgi:hypothetical protein